MRSQSVFTIWGACLLAALAWIFAACAPAHAVPEAVKKACKYDYKRLCRQYKPGTAKMRACMQASIGQLSPRCYDSLLKYGYARRGFAG